MKRIYLFELLALANLAVLLLFFHGSRGLAGSPLANFAALMIALAVQAAAGIVVRCAIAGLRRDRAYFRRVTSAGWIADTLRMVAGGALMIFDYGWIKLVVPVYHPVLFDEAIWQIDRALFFGVSPAEFALHLFSNPAALRVVDWSYGNIFLASTVVAFAYFASDPSRRVRIAFANGNAVLWIAGAWLYMLVPALGPALRFPDLWFAHAESLRVTQALQALLMKNYNAVLRAAAGEPHGPIRIVFGVAAFPSLHVGFQAFVLFWMRKLWRSGEVLFGVFLLVIFLGSLVTGWHYLVDGLAGLGMAYVAYSVFWRRARLGRWLQLRSLLVRRAA